MSQERTKNIPTCPEATLQTLIQLAQRFTQQHPAPRRGRGRPPRYPDHLVLALWLFKQVHNLSFRQWQTVVCSCLPEAPDFSTLHYRIARLPRERLLAFQRWLAERVSHDAPSELLDLLTSMRHNING